MKILSLTRPLYWCVLKQIYLSRDHCMLSISLAVIRSNVDGRPGLVALTQCFAPVTVVLFVKVSVLTPTLRCQIEAPRPRFFCKKREIIGNVVAKVSAAVAQAQEVFRCTSRVLCWRPPWSQVDFALFCAHYFGPTLTFSNRANIIYSKKIGKYCTSCDRRIYCVQTKHWYST